MRSTDAPVAVGLGEILWDLLPGGRQLGGAPANFAYHAGALGARAHVASCVGDDELGREILARLDGLGVDRSCVFVDGDHPTGTVSVALDAAGVPTYTIHENVAWDHLPARAELLTLAGRTQAVCFGTLGQRGAQSRETIRRFLSGMAPGALRIFDINLRQHYYDEPMIRDTLALSNVVKLNDQEVPVVARLLGLAGDQRAVARELFERYALRLVAVTRGARGSLLVTAERSSEHGGVPAQVVDTVGAGDAFTAAVAMGLLNGQDLDAINVRANRLASYVCSQAGATPVMPR